MVRILVFLVIYVQFIHDEKEKERKNTKLVEFLFCARPFCPFLFFSCLLSPVFFSLPYMIYNGLVQPKRENEILAIATCGVWAHHVWFSRVDSFFWEHFFKINFGKPQKKYFLIITNLLPPQVPKSQDEPQQKCI